MRLRRWLEMLWLRRHWASVVLLLRVESGLHWILHLGGVHSLHLHELIRLGHLVILGILLEWNELLLSVHLLHLWLKRHLLHRSSLRGGLPWMCMHEGLRLRRDGCWRMERLNWLLCWNE